MTMPHTYKSGRQQWISAAILLATLYALVGIVFALPTTHVKAWGLAAWGISSVAYAAHIWHERFRLRNSVVAAALHVASAAALGAFGLALGANIHSLCLGST